MNNLILMDSSVLCEWLEVPKHSTKSGYAQVHAQMTSFLKDGCTLYLPIATVIEVGNHIAHIKNGAMRRICAEKFVGVLKSCLEETRPYATIPVWDKDDVKKITDSFVVQATARRSMGDVSIINDFHKLCESNPTAKSVSIWSADGHLSSYRVDNF